MGLERNGRITFCWHTTTRSFHNPPKKGGTGKDIKISLNKPFYKQVRNSYSLWE